MEFVEFGDGGFERQVAARELELLDQIGGSGRTANLPSAAIRNRALLLGTMVALGWGPIASGVGGTIKYPNSQACPSSARLTSRMADVAVAGSPGRRNCVEGD